MIPVLGHEWAGSRATTKTAACGAAHRGFESHPARQYPFGAQNDELVLYSVLYCSRALQWRLERWFSTPELSWRGAPELSLESLLLNIRTLANFHILPRYGWKCLQGDR